MDLQRLYNWLDTPNIMHQKYSNWDWFARLFAKNGNKLNIDTFGISLPDIGLLQSECIELHHFNGILFGYFLCQDGKIDIEKLTDRILNPLLERSKKQGFNLGKERLVYIRPVKD